MFIKKNLMLINSTYANNTLSGTFTLPTRHLHLNVLKLQEKTCHFN